MQTNFIQIHRKNAAAIREEIVAGLQAPQAFASPKYLYDALGSKLFEAICELPEYYPTRVEAKIFEQYLYDIGRSVGRGVTLIDLGAGNCAKAARLFTTLRPVQYVPVDISVEFLRDAMRCLQQRFPHIRMNGIGLDFSNSLELPDIVRSEKRLFFYPGSSIGNFTPEQAHAFLRNVRDACQIGYRVDGSLLIGVDLIKEKGILDAAYDDSLGVTAAFNLNLLRHVNRVLEADFDVRDWKHIGFFNVEKSRVEMHLEARRNLTVNWRGGQRDFARGERIHTENSYKYTPEGFEQLLRESGFQMAHTWTDANRWFMVCHARAA